jgi:tRNA pseudouridine55 synthase
VRSGLLVVNKPAGVSSRYCVDFIQRAVSDRNIKIGHAGTLDPMATGVLLLAIGEATRLVEQLHELDKAYSADFEFGKSSDTLDREGEVTEHPGLPIANPTDLEKACLQWTGNVMQQPPRYSAIKIQGQRAYDLARRGTEFELAARPVAIHRLAITRFEYPHWSLDIQCGSGTYVRSIGRDVAKLLGNVAIMTDLVRTAIGPFRLNEATPLDELKSPAAVESRLRSPIEGLPKWSRVTLQTQQVQALRHGQRIMLADHQWPPNDLDSEDGNSECLAVTELGQLVALVNISQDGQARPVRVFQTTMATSQPITTNTRHNPES